MKRLGILGLTVVLVMGMAVYAGAAPVEYSFSNITANSVANAAIGEAQLSVVVDGFTPMGFDPGVLFTFTNEGSDASSITDVYFDDGSLLALAMIYNGLGVSFSQGASPGDLPGGNNAAPPFEATAGFTADSDPPAQPNGVNPGESLGIFFTLQGTQTIDDVFSELASGALRIGIHVQGFADGGSESFVNNGPPQVPEPSTLLLLGFGLAGMGLYRRMKG